MERVNAERHTAQTQSFDQLAECWYLAGMAIVIAAQTQHRTVPLAEGRQDAEEILL